MLDLAVTEEFPDDIALPPASRPVVEPVEGASSSCGAVFRVRGHDVFICRRWQAWEGSFWCIIDFTAPLTGYVNERCGGIILSLIKNDDGRKVLLMPEDEEALYRYFSLIVETDVLALQKKYPFRFKVEIIRLYQPATHTWKQTGKERVSESCVA